MPLWQASERVAWPQVHNSGLCCGDTQFYRDKPVTLLGYECGMWEYYDGRKGRECLKDKPFSFEAGKKEKRAE